MVYTENDDWPPDTGTDKNYTNGFRLSLDHNYNMWSKLTGSRWFRWVPRYKNCAAASLVLEKCVSSAVHVGQQFYTPDDISVRELIPNDRPYAGWLYVGGSWRASTDRALVATDVYLGVTGPASLARPVQTLAHKIGGVDPPQGWDNQIGGRVGVVVGHSRRAAFDAGTDRNRWLELTPYVGGTGGDIVTEAYAGARLKVGYHLTRDWTHNGIAPVVKRGFVSPNQGVFEIYATADGQGRALLYNAFIDAAPSHRLDQRYLIGDGGIGVGMRIKRVTASYRIAFVSPEYDQARTYHDYKAIKLMFDLN